MSQKSFRYEQWLNPTPIVRTKYTWGDRKHMAADIADAMRAQYELEGIEGDFSDAARHLRDDVGDEELDAEYAKWVKKDLT